MDAVEFARELLDLRDEALAPHELGSPLDGPLAVYGPVTEQNARVALSLLIRHFEFRLERVLRRFAKLPPEARCRVLAEVRRFLRDRPEEEPAEQELPEAEPEEQAEDAG